MVQKGNFKDVLVMKGMGRVDDTRPIDLLEYVMPTSKERKSTPIPLTTVPKKICFSKNAVPIYTPKSSILKAVISQNHAHHWIFL